MQINASNIQIALKIVIDLDGKFLSILIFMLARTLNF